MTAQVAVAALLLAVTFLGWCTGAISPDTALVLVIAAGVWAVGAELWVQDAR